MSWAFVSLKLSLNFPHHRAIVGHIWRNHSHKKRKDSRAENTGVAVHRIHKNNEKWCFLWGIALWKWLWGCFSHFLLLWLLFNASEAVQKIATDQKDYHKCSSCVIVCWIAKIYQWITVKKGWLLGHLRRS